MKWFAAFVIVAALGAIGGASVGFALPRFENVLAGSYVTASQPHSYPTGDPFMANHSFIQNHAITTDAAYPNANTVTIKDVGLGIVRSGTFPNRPVWGPFWTYAFSPFDDSTATVHFGLMCIELTSSRIYDIPDWTFSGFTSSTQDWAVAATQVWSECGDDYVIPHENMLRATD